jgi:DNA-binding CsgD family transcriptional regulator
VNSYSDLTRSEVPAAGLMIATRDRPARSSRYREVLREKGFGDELRAVLRIDGNPWALVGLFREEGKPAFDHNEIEMVSGLSRPLAEALRDRIRPSRQPIADPDAPGPGLMLFTPSGELVSVNEDALAWLDDLPEELGEQPGIGSRLPIFVVATLTRARAVAERLEPGPARVRMRSRSGRWLVCHASCLRDADGRIGHTALVIEPASSGEIAPIIVRAYDLSVREQQITQLIAHGHDTAAIASQLHLSAHTVRGYIKAIFEKVGVCSRGELVAKLFADHYASAHLDLGNHTIAGQ